MTGYFYTFTVGDTTVYVPIERVRLVDLEIDETGISYTLGLAGPGEDDD